MNILGIRFKIILHILAGLLLGGTIALVYLSSSVTFRQFVAQKIEQQFEHDYQCNMRATLDEIDWISCKMVFSGVSIIPRSEGNDLSDPAWSIVAEKLQVHGSWLSLFLNGKLKVSLSLEHVIMMEIFDQMPEKLLQFCRTMFGEVKNAPVLYDVISITDGLIYFKRSCDAFSIQIPYTCNMHSEKEATRMQFYLHDGMISSSGDIWVKNIAGSILSDIPFDDSISQLCAQVQLNYNFCKLEQEIPGFLAGKLEHGSGEFALKSQDGSIVVDPIKIKITPTQCLCDVMIAATAQVLNYLQVPDVLSDVAGHVDLALYGDLYNILQTVQMSLILDNIMYKSKPLIPGGKILITEHDKQGFSGVFAMNEQQKCAVQVFACDEQKKCKIFNLVDIELLFDSGYKILKNDCNVEIVYEPTGIIHGHYNITIQNLLLSTLYALQGDFELKDGKVTFCGTMNDVSYSGALRLYPDYVFESFSAYRGNNLLIDFNTDPTDPLYVVGSVDFSVVHDVVPPLFKMSFAEEGSFVFRGYLKDGICSVTIQTYYAHIRVPYVYNVVQNVTATCEFNIYEKKLVFKDVDVEWYEGKISCSVAKVYFDKNLNWNFVHAPLMLHDVMLSWNKGLYGLVSGRILLNKSETSQHLQIQGQLMMQKAELKENIFSTEFQELLSGMNSSSSSVDQALQPYVDISLFTKNSLQINTSFLTAKALVDVRVQGLLHKTDLLGSIKLISGFLNFPFKSLEIVDGKILFIPEQSLFDPMVEFVAKGKLKRFGVTLKAWGSALDPHVQFEAQPYLSEEQIISLLLLGVEDQSLSLMVPAFLTQRLKDIIFGPALSNIKLQSVFDRLLQSLKYVRFIPQFTNQTARGGVRGIFEVDATEHLQGKIDTNFAHLEDTKFDIDYSATDDVTFRLQKDGPSTYGGQVEFRWKFS